MPADKLGPVVCCVCLFASCVLVSLSNDLAVCAPSASLLRVLRLLRALILVSTNCPGLILNSSHLLYSLSLNRIDLKPHSTQSYC